MSFFEECLKKIAPSRSRTKIFSLAKKSIPLRNAKSLKCLPLQDKDEMVNQELLTSEYKTSLEKIVADVRISSLRANRELSKSVYAVDNEAPKATNPMDANIQSFSDLLQARIPKIQLIPVDPTSKSFQLQIERLYCLAEKSDAELTAP